MPTRWRRSPLFVALGGASYAALALPRNSVGARQLKKNAVTSAKVKNHSLKKADFANGQLPAGPAGPASPAGPTGATGGTGPQGDPGPFPATLPSGKTLTGTYAAEDVNDGGTAHAYASVSFTYRLATAPTVHVVADGATTTGCAGTVDHPTATAGNVCIYRDFDSSTPVAFSPTATIGQAGRTGLVLSVSNAGNAFEYGSWAVTG